MSRRKPRHLTYEDFKSASLHISKKIKKAMSKEPEKNTRTMSYKIEGINKDNILKGIKHIFWS